MDGCRWFGGVWGLPSSMSAVCGGLVGDMGVDTSSRQLYVCECMAMCCNIVVYWYIACKCTGSIKIFIYIAERLENFV